MAADPRRAREIIDERRVLQGYLLDEPNVDKAMELEGWLGQWEPGHLLAFQDAVHGLHLILKRVLDKQSGRPVSRTFQDRTDDLRARGFSREADARDRWLQEQWGGG